MRKEDKYITVVMFLFMFGVSAFYAAYALPQLAGQPYTFVWIGPDNTAQTYERAARDPLPYYWPFDSPQFRVSGEKIMADFAATYDPTMTREKYVPTGQPIIPLS
jgi:hypothetical protein